MPADRAPQSDASQDLPPAPWYIAVQAFGPAAGDRWLDYVEWSGFNQLTELLSLDVLLCPSVIEELTPEDWEHNLHADFLTDLFADLEYLLSRVQPSSTSNVLAVVREPGPGSALAALPRFDFQGYDLIEVPGLGISALTNCGGFPLAFAPGELNPVGLLPSYDRARAVQAALRQHYPAEPHAGTNLWAIWRLARDSPR